MNHGVAPQLFKAYNLLIQLTEMSTRHVKDKEKLAKQLERAKELMDSDVADFLFPIFLTEAEEAFLEDIGKEMETLYNKEIKYDESKNNLVHLKNSSES